MHSIDFSKQRLTRLRMALAQTESGMNDLVERTRFERLLEDAGILLDELDAKSERYGEGSHLLELDPFLATRLIYCLDQCEHIFHKKDEPRTKNQLCIDDPERLLYPSLMQTTTRQLLKVILSVRKKRSGDDFGYNQPTFREVLYLKSPASLQPITVCLLKEPKRRWRQCVTQPMLLAAKVIHRMLSYAKTTWENYRFHIRRKRKSRSVWQKMVGLLPPW